MKNLARVAIVSLTLLFAGQALAQQGYELITPPQNTSTGDKVEVLEFFWYGCPHCYELEPMIDAWDKERRADNVEFIRVAPPLNPQWADQGRAYYAAKILGVLDTFHRAMFDAIHKDHKRLNKVEDIAKFAGTLGLDEDKFLSTMKSFAVEMELKRARQQAIAMRLTGVPGVVVNGKYRTSASLAGGYPAMLDLIDRLAEQEAAN
ncbi:thiol:disulfide interchange protein DsbA/DsbL [Granulosicoccaceae sp. 1_MG-2023]|nr:thiol:disulfide interchange protein DsbA/DsbL [Granulosicoccaceae sp. 1_MG-2023]